MNSHQPHAAREAWEQRRSGRREEAGRKLTDRKEQRGEIEQVAAEAAWKKN